MSHYKNILVLSTSNTRRGVMAERILNKVLKEQGGHDIKVWARGLIVLFREPVNAKAELVLKNNGIRLFDYQSIEVTEEDLDKCDLIITMTEEQKGKVLEEYENLPPVWTMKELAGEEGEVLDPYGKDVMDYEYCFRELERLAEKISAIIIGGQIE